MQRCYGCMKEYSKEYDVCPYCGYIVGTKPESKSHLQFGTKLADRYTVGKALGWGGFGITYIAWDDKLQKAVAVKEYFPNAFSTRSEGDTQISCLNADAERFFTSGVKKMLDEARRLSSFSKNENIVDIYNFFEENNTAYIVMEYLEGKNLKQYLEENGGKLAPERAVELILPVLNALEDMHNEHLIHRDISPDNIYLCNDGKVKLLDFGSARLASEDSEKSLSVMLKRGFAPKEQYSSRSKQGAWTDVYAVCATLYKMITGETPVESTDRDDEELKSFSELGVNGCDELEKIILKGMAIKPADRIQSVQELRAQLTAVNKTATKKEPEKQEISQQEKGKKPVNIKIIIAAVAAVVIVAVLSVLGVKYIKNNSEPSGQITSSVTTTEESKVTLVETGEPAWKKAYIDFLENLNLEPDLIYISLGFVDDDDVPELFVTTGSSHIDGVKVYTYYNDKTCFVCEAGEFGTVKYVERNGYICDYYGSMGDNYYEVIELVDGKGKTLYKAHDDSNAPIGDAEPQITINDKPVSVGDMEEFIMKYFDDEINPAIVSIEVNETDIQKHITDFKVGEEYAEESKVTLVETGEPEWKKAYVDVVKEASGDDVSFELGYVDDDAVPELFVAADYNRSSQVDVYTYRNGKAYLICKAGQFGSAQYIERKGYICSVITAPPGTIDYLVEELKNGKTNEVYHAYDYSSDIVASSYDGDLLVINDKQVTREEMDIFTRKYFNRDSLHGESNSTDIKTVPTIEATDENIKKHITDFKG